MIRLNLTHQEISKYNDYEINGILEDDEREAEEAGEEIIKPIDLIPNNEANKMKILCMQLANSDYNTYISLYNEANVLDLYEALTLINAINWRPNGNKT